MMMRSFPLAIVLAVSTFILIGVALAGSASGQETDPWTTYGPLPWELGMEWAWSSDDVEERSKIDDHTKLQTMGGQWDVWRSQTVREGDTDQAHRVTMWVENTHRRAYDEVTISRTGADPVTALIEYSPPAAFPMWESLHPCNSVHEEVTEHTSYRTGMQYAGSEETTWNWTTAAGCDVFNITTPAGTFEAFNVSVYKQEVDGDARELYRYVYSHEARYFVATYDGDQAVDMTLDRFQLDPPPFARGFASPSIVDVGEEVTLHGELSHAIVGEIESYTWRLPAGTTWENETLTEPTTVQGENVTVRFDEPGEERYRFVLTVTGTNGQSAQDPVTVRVVEPESTFFLEGLRWTFVDEPTSFLLVPPENRTIEEAVWTAEGIDDQEGLNPEIVFPESGSYTVTVTYVDTEGNNGTLTHAIYVIGGDGFSIRGDSDEGPLQAGEDPVGPTILNPENGTRMGSPNADIVVKTTGLEDPNLVLPNGLRVPLSTDEPVDIATVPITPPRSTIQLMDGERMIDQVTLVYDPDDASATTGAEGTDPNETPFPWALPLVLAPLLRRRKNA